MTIATTAALLLASAPAAQGSPESPGDRLVRVELLADRAAIRPGGTFSLGVRLRIERGWHVYWENHGDSGFPTRASIAAPEGFEVGPLRFPGPERHVDEGDIVTFVHHRELLLLADVRAPAELPGAGGALELRTEASWLVCSDVCYPGSGRASLSIPVATADADVAPANEELFAETRKRLPRPWTELEGASVAWSGTRERPVASIEVPRAEDLELFPLSSETLFLLGREVGPAGRLTARFRFRAAASEDEPRLRAVLRVDRDRAQSFHALDSAPDAALPGE